MVKEKELGSIVQSLVVAKEKEKREEFNIFKALMHYEKKDINFENDYWWIKEFIRDESEVFSSLSENETEKERIWTLISSSYTLPIWFIKKYHSLLDWWYINLNPNNKIEEIAKQLEGDERVDRNEYKIDMYLEGGSEE